MNKLQMARGSVYDIIKQESIEREVILEFRMYSWKISGVDKFQGEKLVFTNCFLKYEGRAPQICAKRVI